MFRIDDLFVDASWILLGIEGYTQGQIFGLDRCPSNVIPNAARSTLQQISLHEMTT